MAAPRRALLAAVVAIAAGCGSTAAELPSCEPAGLAAICEPSGPPRQDLAAVGALVSRLDHPYRRLADTLCSATLVAPNAALTAGHCVAGWQDAGRQLSFTLADRVWLPGERGEAPRGGIAVVEVALAPPRQKGAAVADLALVRLQEAVTAVPPAAMALGEAPEDDALRPGAQVIIAGYGRSTPPDAPGFADDDGSRRWAWSRLVAVGAQALQVGDAATAGQRCFGDSGGPTLLPDAAGRLRIVSIGGHRFGPRPCREGAVEPRLAGHRAWLEAVLQQWRQGGGGHRPAATPLPDAGA